MNLLLIGGEDVSARIPLAKKLIEKGVNVSIAGTQEPSPFEIEGIPYKNFFLDRELNVKGDLSTTSAIKELLSSITEPTIVHAFDTKLTLYVPIAAKNMYHIKVVRTITGMGRIFSEDGLKNKLLRAVYNFMQKSVKDRVAHTIFQNSDDYEYFINKRLTSKDRSSIVLSSGIDLDTFSKNEITDKEAFKSELGIDNDHPTFILVSRMVRQKGIYEYLKAAELCVKAGQKFNYLLVGQIDDQNDAVSLEEIEKYPFVKYLGKRNDVDKLLQVADVFVLPTFYREGVPRVLLEASATAVPSITTDMPGCRDVVKHNETGLLVQAKSAESLSEAMVDLGNDKEKQKLFGEKSLKFVDNFDLNKVAQSYYEIYKRL